jgi:hypothetical protein
VTRFALPAGGRCAAGSSARRARTSRRSSSDRHPDLLDESGSRCSCRVQSREARDRAARLEMLLKDGNIHPRRIEELTRRTSASSTTR